MIEYCSISVDNKIYILKTSRYFISGTIAIVAYEEDHGEPYAKVSIASSNYHYQNKNDFIYNHDLNNEPLFLQAMLDTGLFEIVDHTTYGYLTSPQPVLRLLNPTLED